MKILDYIKKFLFYKVNDEHEFMPLLAEIEDRPMNPLGQTIFWIIMFTMTISCLWLYLGKVDIVVTARGIVLPDGDQKIIQPLEKGVISNILVKEGDYVKRGQLLVEIDPSDTKPVIDSMKQQLTQVQLEKQRLNSQAARSGFYPVANSNQISFIQKNMYNSSMSALHQELNVKEIELNKIDQEKKAIEANLRSKTILLNESSDRERRLSKVLDIIPKTQYEDVRQKIVELTADIESLNYQLNEAYQKQDQTRVEISNIQSKFDQQNFKELSDKENQSSSLEAQIKEESFKHTKQKIISPVDGYVTKILIHTEGGVVTPAEKIMLIVPADAEMTIKSTVLNRDIGFIAENMHTSIKVDTFDFQKYGILKGKVNLVSKNSIDDPKLGPVYEVYVKPVNTKLMVEGKEEPIRPGMSVTCEIKVGKRRIIEFFLYPLVKYLDESIKVR